MNSIEQSGDRTAISDGPQYEAGNRKKGGHAAKP